MSKRAVINKRQEEAKHQETEERQDEENRRAKQLEAFKKWQAENLAEDSYLNRKKGVEPPPFTGDWSHLVRGSMGKDLRGADFRGALAQIADFRDADLQGANFAGTDLRHANFEGVKLLGVNFEGAELLGARFRDADLREARFSNSKGLTIESFGGAKLQAATLPGDVGEFKELENIAEISKYIQRMFQFLVALCGFAALTILSIKDQDLILRDGQSMTSLPVLNANVTPLNFSYVLPSIIFIIFLYQFLYTMSLWRLFSFLPAYFPDGTPLDRRAYPMVLNTFVRYHLLNVRDERFDRFQCLLRGLIALGVPPLTLLVFWISCLRLHDPMLSGFHSTLFGLGLGIVLFIFHFSRAILRNEWRLETMKFGSFAEMSASIIAVVVTFGIIAAIWFIPGALGLVVCILVVAWLSKLFIANLGNNRLLYSIVHLACCVSIVSALMWTVSLNCFKSKNHSLKIISLGDKGKFPPEQDDSFFNNLAFARFLSLFQSDPFIDIRSRFVSHRPESWTGHPKTEGDEMLSVSGADLEGLDLRSMDAERVFLAKANLRQTNLEGAYLRFANLRDADLSDARLGRSYLRGASLREANLQGADLQDAIFSIDEDDPRKMVGANFQGAKIDFRTKFDPDDLIESRVNNLALAYFGETDPDKVNDKHKIMVKNLNAKLKILEGRGVPMKTDTELSLGRMIDKKFVGLAMAGADLAGFDLTDSTFSCSDGNEADLSGALFIGADLTNVKFLSVNLEGADFTRAILNGTKFECCKLEGTIFTDAKGHEVQGLDELTMKLHGMTDDAPVKLQNK